MNKMRIYLCLLAILSILTTQAQLRHPVRDAQGRHQIERGFVVITGNSNGEVFYSQMDYSRMARLGSNVQVIRIDPTKLGSSAESKESQEQYLVKLDSLVDMARNVGMKTTMKMTVYGLEDFTWENFWNNKKDIQGEHIDKWRILWERYKSDDYVVGYDLLNEPRKMSMDVTYAQITDDYLIPFYEKIIDEAVKYNPNKRFYCQSIFVNKGEQEENMQYAPIEKPIKRKNVVFCPHTYKNVAEEVAPTMEMFDECSKVMNAPMFVGEWGYPTLKSTDSDLDKQFHYTKVYEATAREFDRLGCGSIKAWFTGNPSMLKYLNDEEYTWSIFQDKNSVGSYERKYIMDIIARPYPQLIAGDIYSFNFDFSTRKLMVEFKSDNSKGASKIYISADRFYPDGFTIECGEGLRLAYNPMKNVGLEVLENSANVDTDNFIWNSSQQQLIILQWADDKAMTFLNVIPGVNR